MKSAQRKSVDQQQSLIAIQGLQTDTSHPEVARPGVLHPEIVNASSVCHEMGRGSLQTLAHNYRRLPTGTKMAFTGVDGEVDIGIPVRCSYPFPVEAGSGGGFGKRPELCIVLDEIDQCLSLVRLHSSMLAFVCFHVEFGLLHAAPRWGLRTCGHVLCKSRRCEQKECDGNFHLGHSKAAITL